MWHYKPSRWFTDSWESRRCQQDWRGNSGTRESFSQSSTIDEHINKENVNQERKSKVETGQEGKKAKAPRSAKASKSIGEEKAKAPANHSKYSEMIARSVVDEQREQKFIENRMAAEKLREKKKYLSLLEPRLEDLWRQNLVESLKTQR